jgi:HlyD family secretion protein
MKKKLRKILINLAGVAAILGAGYYYYYGNQDEETPVTYTVEAAALGPVVVTAEGSGQVAAAEELAVHPGTSGEVTSLRVKAGDLVEVGDLLFTLDSRDLAEDIETAELNLRSAEIALERLLAPLDELDSLRAENDLDNAEAAVTDAKESLSDKVRDGYDEAMSVLLDLPAVMTGLHAILYEPLGSAANQQWGIDYYADAAGKYDARAYDLRTELNDQYAATKAVYDRNQATFDALSRQADPSLIKAVLSDTRKVTLMIDDLGKQAANFIQFYDDQLTYRNIAMANFVATHQSTLDGYARTLSSLSSGLGSSLSGITAAETSIEKAERSLATQKLSYAESFEPADELDVATQELTVHQRRAALDNLRAAYADYRAVAPIAGKVVSVDIERGDDVTTGTTAVTVISPNLVASVSLSEIDAAAVRVGQKATVTLDALPDLALTGIVSEIDEVGTVSQSVVTYGATITLDTQDERIKPSMTATAAIVTAARLGVLTVPTAAVKSRADGKQVQVAAVADPSALAGLALTADQLTARTVETGLSDGLVTEIISGLEAGEYVVTRTVDPAAASSGSTSSGGFGGPGMGIMR